MRIDVTQQERISNGIKHTHTLSICIYADGRQRVGQVASIQGDEYRYMEEYSIIFVLIFEELNSHLNALSRKVLSGP